jgi:hypothetical protein
VDRCRIGRAPDYAIKSIHFSYEVTLTKPTDGRVAAHRSNLGKVETHKCRLCAHPGRSAGRFDASVAAADYDDVKILHGGADNPIRIGIKGQSLFHVEQC